MTTIASNTSPTWTRNGDNWTLASNGRTLAVIEPCWSDRHACLFLANSKGELAYDGMYSRRIARLRICLRLWFSHTGGGGARPATSRTALLQLYGSPREHRPIMPTTFFNGTEEPK